LIVEVYKRFEKETMKMTGQELDKRNIALENAIASQRLEGEENLKKL